jgi:hypothetical protein
VAPVVVVAGDWQAPSPAISAKITRQLKTDRLKNMPFLPSQIKKLLFINSSHSVSTRLVKVPDLASEVTCGVMDCELSYFHSITGL